MNRTDYFLYIDTENEDLYEKWSDTPIEIKSYISINIGNTIDLAFTEFGNDLLKDFKTKSFKVIEKTLIFEGALIGEGEIVNIRLIPFHVYGYQRNILCKDVASLSLYTKLKKFLNFSEEDFNLTILYNLNLRTFINSEKGRKSRVKELLFILEKYNIPYTDQLTKINNGTSKF